MKVGKLKKAVGLTALVVTASAVIKKLLGGVGTVKTQEQPKKKAKITKKAGQSQKT